MKNVNPDVAQTEALFRRYAPAIYDKCLKLLGDRAEAEDAVQETFIAAHRSLGSFTYGTSHLPWLYRIATRVCFRHLRRRRRRSAIPIGDLDRLRDPSGDPVRVLQMRQALRVLASSLDQRTWEIVVAHHIDGMAQGQIADYLGISRRAVVKRLTRIKRRSGELRGELAIVEGRHG